MDTIAIILVISGIVLSGWGIWANKKIYEVSLNWPSTEGKVSYINNPRFESWDELMGRTVSYRIDIQYKYDVSDCNYVGNRFSYSGNDYDLDTSEKMLTEYAVGTLIPVYYNPSNPVESVLKPGGKIHLWPITLGAIGLIIGIRGLLS
jgi:hypothetical protein